MPEETYEEHGPSSLVFGLMCAVVISIVAFFILATTMGIIRAYLWASLIGSVALFLLLAAHYTCEARQLLLRRTSCAKHNGPQGGMVGRAHFDRF
ncbi:hypothetical protein AL036_21555 [Salipiger aestuarii]|uniref:Uncharacterized protein n=2 Tax=Salipiger aestuarii TaxID=568098 RepID=A0A327Y7Z4_9RHOB|nr:hypothetical protein [Salipiger aestuarii]EIE50960.1 hypothetical protein C357_11014 [Citreicella sp. 357]KAA8604555.1 hypothetical protein AL036_21555 [Salipiger aestuarii]KAB2539482.1 hypothetical protein AL035_18085 [Salipiger aestuarii]RAK17203.1 hypothetical protein ATI53_10151 [Salipiger aestuarii]